jgi:hypothetical protein
MKPPRAFAFLYVVLIIASVTTTISLAASVEGILSGNRLRADAQSAEVRMLTMRCGELLLMQVRNNTALTSSGTLTSGTGSCVYTVTGTSPAKVISITATMYTLTKRLTITTAQVTPNITSTWVES